MSDAMTNLGVPGNGITLWPYQAKAVADFEAVVARGLRHPLLVIPTGGGKTIVFCEIIKRYVKQHLTAVVLSHRRDITRQRSLKLTRNSISHGIIQAGFDQRPMAPVQVASIATLLSRCLRSKSMALPPAHLLVIDEAHHAPATSYRRIVEAYPNAVVLGVTATPVRGDGRGLGGIFDVLIEGPQVPELIDDKRLVKSRVYAPVRPDLKGVRTVAGDYVESQLAERMDTAKLVGDIVSHWLRFGQRFPTVCFASGVAHSVHLCDMFCRSGVRAEHLDGSTSIDDRDAILARLKSGETEVVTNCMVLTEGWDMPEVGCCILARPTKKMGLYRQMIGRVLRAAPEKEYAVILDHAGAVWDHGLPEDRIEWSLRPDHLARSPQHRARQSKSETGLCECQQCSALRVGGQPCLVCGWKPKRSAEYIRTRNEDLALVKHGRSRVREYSKEERELWHAMLVHIQRSRGYKENWHACTYKDKFGTWPKPYGYEPQPIEPSPEVKAWVQSRLIAFAKRKQREERAA